MIETSDSVPQETLDSIVINLSDTPLTRHELYTFYLGKSFAPTPGLPNMMQFNDDIKKWCTSLRSAYNMDRFNKAKNIQQIANVVEDPMLDSMKKLQKDLIKSEYRFEVAETKSHALELFLKKVIDDVNNHRSNRVKSNPSNIEKETRQAISDMKNWDDKVIRLFDKGSGFFVLNKSDYIKRTMEELNDETTFLKISDEQNAIDSCISDIKSWVTKYKSEPGMTDKLSNWVIPTNKNSPGNNYVNLKAHKPDKNYPNRLISTGCNSYIKNLSILTSYELKKVKLKYNINSTDEFLQQVHEINESGILKGKSILMCSFDINSMFPNITKNLGLSECGKRLDKRSEKLFSTNCMLDAIELTLDHNLTKFNDIMFRQIKGTAMGPSNACDYADTAMNRLDELVHSENLLEEHHINKPLLFTRFRDDIFVLWDECENELLKFFDWLNSFHSEISFSMTTPTSFGLEFLDTYVYLNNGTLYTKPYSKLCDNHDYLYPTSCHPSHTLENVPYNIAFRIYKICSDNEDYNNAKIEYSNYLERRGYNRNLVADSFTKVEKLNRLEIIYKKNSNKNTKSKDERCFPLVCDFNPALPPVGKFISKYKHILQLDDSIKDIIKPEKVFVSHRGNKTLKDLLVPSKIGSAKPKETDSDLTCSDFLGCTPCKKGCKVCKLFLKPSKVAKSYHNEQTFIIKQHIDCKSKNVIYMVNDLICNRSYIGCTSNEFVERFRNHKSHIRNNVKSCELTTHFSESNAHNFDKSLPLNEFDSILSKHINVVIIEEVKMCKGDNNETRLRKCKLREAYWQNQLQTLYETGGLNKRDARKEL